MTSDISRSSSLAEASDRLSHSRSIDAGFRMKIKRMADRIVPAVEANATDWLTDIRLSAAEKLVKIRAYLHR